jgi:hypothetical protein
MDISDDVIVNVMTNVLSITIILLSVYPVLYIIRSMIDFIATAFDGIDTKDIFGGLGNKLLLKFHFRKLK